MNTLRCFLFAIVVISSSTFGLGGEIQGSGKSDLPSASTGVIVDETQIAWQDLTTKILLEILLTIY